jgi:hypothetical protein
MLVLRRIGLTVAELVRRRRGDGYRMSAVVAGVRCRPDSIAASYLYGLAAFVARGLNGCRMNTFAACGLNGCRMAAFVTRVLNGRRMAAFDTGNGCRPDPAFCRHLSRCWTHTGLPRILHGLRSHSVDPGILNFVPAGTRTQCDQRQRTHDSHHDFAHELLHSADALNIGLQTPPVNTSQLLRPHMQTPPASGPRLFAPKGCLISCLPPTANCLLPQRHETANA